MDQIEKRFRDEHRLFHQRQIDEKKADMQKLIERFEFMPDGAGKEEVRVAILLYLKEIDDYEKGTFSQLGDWMAANEDKWKRFAPPEHKQ
jgi:hypothetical protein